MAERSRHTLLLVQYNHSLASRTCLDFNSLAAALDGVCLLYEKELKALNPSMKNITYDISDLYSYLDQLADVALLVYAARRTRKACRLSQLTLVLWPRAARVRSFQEPIHAYLPRNKEWVKRQLYTHLQGQAAK